MLAADQTQSNDHTNPKYIHPLLTHPLPPMVMRVGGEEIAHSDLPLPTPEELMGGAELEETKPPEGKEEESDPNDPFGDAARSDGGHGRAMGRGGEMGTPMARPNMAMGRGGEMGMPMGRPGGTGRGGEMGAMPRGGTPGDGGEGAKLPNTLGTASPKRSSSASSTTPSNRATATATASA